MLYHRFTHHFLCYSLNEQEKKIVGGGGGRRKGRKKRRNKRNETLWIINGGLFHRVPCTTCPRQDFFSSLYPKYPLLGSLLSAPFALTPTHLLSRVLFTSRRRKTSFSASRELKGARLWYRFPLLGNFDQWLANRASLGYLRTRARYRTMKFMAVAVDCGIHRSAMLTAWDRVADCHRRVLNFL